FSMRPEGMPALVPSLVVINNSVISFSLLACQSYTDMVLLKAPICSVMRYRAVDCHAVALRVSIPEGKCKIWISWRRYGPATMPTLDTPPLVEMSRLCGNGSCTRPQLPLSHG